MRGGGAPADSEFATVYGVNSHRADRSRRADARRSIAAILDAATVVLAERPEASMTDVARAAGVTRQTVYAHFASREQLIEAAFGRAVDEAVVAIDAARLDEGPADAALARLLEVSWAAVARHGAAFEVIMHTLGPEAHLARHAPVVERLERLLERGRAQRRFADDVPLRWQSAAVVGLVHAAGQEVGAGRLRAEHAGPALRRTVLRALGAPSAATGGDAPGDGGDGARA